MIRKRIWAAMMASLGMVFAGVSMASPAAADTIVGWDTTSCAAPTTDLGTWAWSGNTGLWRTADKNALTGTYANTTTTSNGQCITAKKLGDVTVNHTGVTIKLSDVRGTITNNTSSPVKVIYSDLSIPGPNTGVDHNLRGPVSVHRSNIWGGTDVWMSCACGANDQGTASIISNSFVHDLNRVEDSGQGAGEPSHNDGGQINTPDTDVTYQHVTWWLSGTTNYAPDGKSPQVATRNGGPGWTNNGSPTTSTCLSAGNSITNTALMVGSGGDWGRSDVLVEDSLFHGCNTAYTALNVQQGGSVVARDNLIYDDTFTKANPIAGRATFDTFTGNVDQYGNVIP